MDSRRIRKENRKRNKRLLAKKTDKQSGTVGVDENEQEHDWNGGLLPQGNSRGRASWFMGEEKKLRPAMDDYFAGKIIFIPEDLRDYCLGIKEYPDSKGRMLKRRIEFKEGLIILWSVIHCGYYENAGDGWKYVHSDNFTPIWNDDSITRAGKNCLIEGGYLEEDGKYLEGVRPMGYKTLYSGKIVKYEIKSKTKRLDKVLAVQPADCKLFQDNPELLYQRECLDKLSVDEDVAKEIAVHTITAWINGVDLRAKDERHTHYRRIQHQLNSLAHGMTVSQKQDEIKKSHARKIEKRTKKLREVLANEEIDKVEQYKIEEQIKEIERSPMSDSEMLSTFTLPIMKMNWRKGRLTIGHKSGRIFSPLTGIAREFREAIRWDIDGLSGKWEIIDLICSQPTLIAYTSGDEQMKKDCLKNKYYPRIMDELGQSRDEAKVSFCQYAYGPNRNKLTSQNINSFTVQNKVMKEFYPTAYQYIWNGKQGDHRLFIQRLQQRESDIFVGQIMPWIIRRRIPAITIHDGIFCPAEYADDVYEIAKEVLRMQPEKIEQDLDRKTGPHYLNEIPETENK